jgi:hypothetical protein
MSTILLDLIRGMLVIDRSVAGIFSQQLLPAVRISSECQNDGRLSADAVFNRRADSVDPRAELQSFALDGWRPIRLSF